MSERAQLARRLAQLAELEEQLRVAIIVTSTCSSSLHILPILTVPPPVRLARPIDKYRKLCSVPDEVGPHVCACMCTLVHALAIGPNT